MMATTFDKPGRFGNRARRSGATVVEAAIVFNLLFLLLIGLLVVGLGVFRYQETAWLAREAARYASVRGKQYEYEVSGAKAATAKDVYDNAIAPNAQSMDMSKLTYSVTWDKDNAPTRVTSEGVVIGNTVTVTVTYEWTPELFFISPIELSSSSTMPMSF